MDWQNPSLRDALETVKAEGARNVLRCGERGFVRVTVSDDDGNILEICEIPRPANTAAIIGAVLDTVEDK